MTIWTAMQERALRLVPGYRRHRLVGMASLWRMKREFQIGFLRHEGLLPHHTLLDLGSGTLRGGIPLINYLNPGNYTGVDVREETLHEAWDELRSAGLEDKRPDLVVIDDLGEAALSKQFDYIWAFSVLIHMSDPILDRALNFVSHHLAGPFYANVNIGAREPASWLGFPIIWRRFDAYQALAKRHGLLVHDIGSLRDLGHASGIDAQDDQRMLRFRKDLR